MFFKSKLKYSEYPFSGDCGGTVCQTGESCDTNVTPNVCKCGSSSTCVGQSTGSVCVGGECKCTAMLDKCTAVTGMYCDAAANSGNGVCKCTQALSSCPTGETCDNSGNGQCECGTGTGTSCAGLSTGSVCHSGTCKCSSTVAACTDGHSCNNGACKCVSSSGVVNNLCSGDKPFCNNGVCGKYIVDFMFGLRGV